jgi:hypothetical protein
VPSASTVLRRALVIWGAGHLALGDRRGWLLAAGQPLAVACVVVLGALLIEGSLWLVVFAALVALLGIWLGQAIHAQRLARLRGAQPGGEFQLALVFPLVIALLSGFWLLAGARATPAATLQHYVAAWQADRPDAALPLFAAPLDQDALAARWAAQRGHVEALVSRSALRYGGQSGLDPAQPFNSLRFEEPHVLTGGPAGDQPVRAVDGAIEIVVDVVRRRRAEATLLGLIPTATQETVIVERLGHVRLVAAPASAPSWLPLPAAGHVWLIDEVILSTGD